MNTLALWSSNQSVGSHEPPLSGSAARSVTTSNFAPMLQVGFKNLDLVKYLLDQLRQNEEERLALLREFLPKATSKDWSLSVAGQRVQIIKRTSEGGVLRMGTEVVASDDGSIAALLGASPGASTSVSIMLEVLKRCWGDKMASIQWRERLSNLLPSYGKQSNPDYSVLRQMRMRSDSILNLL